MRPPGSRFGVATAGPQVEGGARAAGAEAAGGFRRVADGSRAGDRVVLVASG